jgi:L-seryl-tRNA(Ser) seleniumtransferase
LGGGTTPCVALPSAAVSLPESLAGPLRHGPQVQAGHRPAVAGRITEGRLLLDMYAVEPDDDRTLAAAVLAAAGRGS